MTISRNFFACQVLQAIFDQIKVKSDYVVTLGQSRCLELVNKITNHYTEQSITLSVRNINVNTIHEKTFSADGFVFIDKNKKTRNGINSIFNYN